MYRIFSKRLIFYLIVLLVLDLALMPYFRWHDIQPILIYLIILYSVFQWGIQQTLMLAFGVGLLRDLVSSQTLGIETTALVCASLVLDFLVQKMDRYRLSLKLIVTFVFVFFVLLFSLFLSGFISDVPMNGYALWVALGSALYTTALVPIFFFVTSVWFGQKTLLKQYELFK